MTTKKDFENYIDINKKKPPSKIKIRLVRYIYGGDCVGLIKQWESTGWMLDSGLFSVKNVDGLTLSNSIPTHWKNL